MTFQRGISGINVELDLVQAQSALNHANDPWSGTRAASAIVACTVT